MLDDVGPIPFLGDGGILGGLKSRIRNSSGGSFLVTGFRGTGKTTVILRMLGEVEAMEPDTLDYLPVVLNVARPVSLDQLLFEVVRRLFEALIDRQILEALSADVRRALVLAYARTSLSFKETRSETTERSQALDLGVARVAAPLLGSLTPRLGLSRKRTDSMATESSFLTYSHGDVEHDFLRILDLLNRPQTPPLSRWRRMKWRLRGGGKPAWQGRVVVVLDELDKLPPEDPTVINLLSGLKNILTTRHVHFIFVGGPELHDAAILDASRGNSVYESVFAYQVYLPCLWGASEQLLDAVLEPDAVTPEQRATLRDYFDYKARGIPRLLLRELNELVNWQDGRAYLHIDETTAARIQLYARLQAVVNDFAGEPDEDDLFTLAIDRDRWRLGTHYIMDWILRHRRGEFAVSEILSRRALDAGGWLTAASPRKVEELVDHLVDHGICRVARDPSSGTIIGDAPQERTYEMETDVRRELSLLARDSIRERRDLSMAGPDPFESSEQAALSASASTPWIDTDGLGTLHGGRYELAEVIGRGGVGTVYRARDLMLDREVAIKVLEAAHLRNDETVRARFQREAAIASSLSHRGIVTTYEAFDEHDGRLGIVMELLHGDPLRTLIPLPAERAVAVADALLGAIDYLAGQGMMRIDLKPENVIVRADGSPVIVDLGIVKATQPDDRDFDTMAPVIVGTPAYMSPEQIRGERVDIRSDLHALGLVLFEMVTGEQPFHGETTPSMLWQVLNADLDTTRMPVSAALRGVVARATAREPNDRFATPADMRSALLATPEGRAIARSVTDRASAPEAAGPATPH
jgi:serine/threonine-protein kinase